MIRRRLLVIVPALAVGLVIAVLLGPGRPRETVSAKILVAPSVVADAHSIRLLTMRRIEGVDTPQSLDGIALQVDGQERWRGASDGFGIAEIALEAPIADGARIRVTHAERVLADGVAKIRTGSLPARETARASGSTDGNVVLAIELARGNAVPPFPERIVISARDADGRPVRTTVVVKLTNATPDQLTAVLDERGEHVATIQPLSGDVEITMDAAVEGRTSTFRGMLPTTLAGIWVDPTLDAGAIAIASPAPRKVAFVSFHDGAGRISGTAVELNEAADGFFRGHAQVADAAALAAVVVSSDPGEKSQSTVAWPVDRAHGRVIVEELELALDGGPTVIQGELARVRRTRLLTTIGLSLAAALEIALLLWTSRKTRSDLEKHFSSSRELYDELGDAAPVGAEGPAEIGAEIQRSEGGGAFPVEAPRRSAVLLAAIAVMVIIVFGAIVMLYVDP